MMSLEVASHHMQGILGFLNKPPQQAAAFVESVYKKCCWMQPDRFAKVCSAVEDELQPGRLPTYPKFKAIYNSLADTLNWRTADAANRKTCATCRGFGWIYVTLTSKESGNTDKFNKPCPDCRKEHPYMGMPPLPGWVEDEMIMPTNNPVTVELNAGIPPFLSACYEDIEPEMSPEEALDAFNRLRKEGALKVRKGAKPNLFQEIVINAEKAVAVADAPVTEHQAGKAEPAADPDSGELPPF